MQPDGQYFPVPRKSYIFMIEKCKFRKLESERVIGMYNSSFATVVIIFTK